MFVDRARFVLFSSPLRNGAVGNLQATIYDRERLAQLSFREAGLYTFVRWNTFFTNPPLCITEAELREALAIIDRGLEITDRAVS